MKKGEEWTEPEAAGDSEYPQKMDDLCKGVYLLSQGYLLN